MTIRDVSQSLSLSLELEGIKVTELYEVTLRDGNTYYFTSHQVDVVWDGITYTALPITRDPIRTGINLEMESCMVYVAGISGDLVTYVQDNNLDDAKVTIKRIVRGASYAADNEWIVYEGYADVSYSRSILQLDLRPWIDTLNIQVPRHIFEEPCNNCIFDETCGLTQSSFSYTGAATGGNQSALIDTNRGLVFKAQFSASTEADTIKKGDGITGSMGGAIAVAVNIMYEDDGSGRIWYCELDGTQFVDGETVTNGSATITISGTPEEVDDFYERGELYIRTGANAGQRRPILTDQSYTITTFWPFPNANQAGDSYTIWPGCDNRANETCHSWYGNDTNFRGFLYIPRVEETLP